MTGSILALALASATAVCAAAPDSARQSVLKTIDEYRAAMTGKSLDKLAGAVDPALTVMEGVYLNTSWADYRDNHIGPEMKEWKEFRIADPELVSLSVDGDWAYAVTRATYTLVFPDKSLVLAGAETFVLRKSDGGWRIRHIHSSGKKLRETK